MSILSLCGCNTTPKEDPIEIKDEFVVNVMDQKYGAVGDGITCDRNAIQLSIDEVSKAGGGTVLLPAEHTFLTGNLIMKSNVHLKFGDNATLLQSPNPDDYIEVRGYDYGEGFVQIGEPHRPLVGVKILPYDEKIWPESTGYWRECWYWNYPLIYADKGTHDVKISGNGTIQSTKFDPSNVQNCIYMLMIGMYGVENLVVSDITINHEHSHCFDFVTCNKGIVHNVKTWTPASTAKDGQAVESICDSLKLFNCQNFLVSGCHLASGDDSLLILSSYKDTRLDRWASSTDVYPTRNIEISNCTIPTYFKSLGFCALGMLAPHYSDIEMSNIYIHDNKFAVVGVWSGFGWMNIPHDTPRKGDYVPMKNFRWERNNYEYWPGTYVYNKENASIQDSMINYPVSDQISDDPRLHSMTSMMNTDFELAEIGYWIAKTENSSIAECREESNNHFGYLGKLEEGVARLYEGVYLKKGSYCLKARIKAMDGARAFLQVTDQKDILVKQTEYSSSTESEVTLEFNIENDGNYRLGVKGTTSGYVMMDDFSLESL